MADKVESSGAKASPRQKSSLQTGNRLSVPGLEAKKTQEDDSGDSEFWDEAAYARAITPSAALRQSAGVNQMYAAVTDSAPHDSERREIELNKKLSKFSEKRNSRIKANKGFFLRDKESVPDNEEDELNLLKKDATPADNKRFNEKFRESLELYLHPKMDDSSHKQKQKQPKQSNGKLKEGLFRCLKCKREQGEEKTFTSFFERNLHYSLAHSGSIQEVICTAGNCGRPFDLWWYPPHVESRHNQTVAIQCPVQCCQGIEIQALEQVWSHVVKTAGAVKYVCPICLHDCHFLNSHQLSNHLHDQHNVEKVNICVVCCAKKSPKIPNSRMRASVHTAKCLVCAKKSLTGLTPKYLLENAMAHLQEFHSHTAFLCISCMTIREANDQEHYKNCLHATSEGLRKGGANGFPEGFLHDAIRESFREAGYEDLHERTPNWEDDLVARDAVLDQRAVTNIEDVEDQMEWRKKQAAEKCADSTTTDN